MCKIREHYLVLLLILAFASLTQAAFVWNETGNMVYDGAGADAGIDPYTQSSGDGDINIRGELTVTTGTLTIDTGSSWGDKIGHTGEGSVTVDGGTLNWVVDNDNEDRLMLGNAGSGNAIITLNGGTFNVIGPGGYDHGEQNVRFGSDGADSTLSLNAGAFNVMIDIPVAFGGKWTNTGTTWNDSSGTSVMTIVDGSFSVAGSVFGVGSNAVINFVSSGSGFISVMNWTSADFETLLTDGRIQIDGQTVTDLSQFMVTDGSAGSPGILSLPQGVRAIPADQAVDVALDQVLSWELLDPNALSVNLSFGADFNDVNAGLAVVENGLTNTSYNPGPLMLETVYYWRLDLVYPGNTVVEGDVWSFETEPVAFALDVNNLVATASSINTENNGPEKTIDESGLQNELHSTISEHMWVSADSAPGEAWIEYALDESYTLHEMYVWNANGANEDILGFGVKEALIEVSVDGDVWTTVEPNIVLAQATGSARTAVNSIVDMKGTQGRYVRITALSNWSELGMKNYSLSEVRFTTIPTAARRPNPADGSTDVSVSQVLSWRSGRYAAQHEVYLGVDVNEMSLVDTVTERQFAPTTLVYGQDYVWSVTEVNEARPVNSYAGDLWSFSTPPYRIVDDMESYGVDNFIYETWADGYDNQNDDNSSQVGNDDSPYVEQVITYAGEQSMPLYYANEDADMYATAIKTLDGEDWTEGGLQTLTLFFMGQADNSGGQLYVQVNNSKVICESSLALGVWTQWDIDLSEFASVDNVTSLTIGVDGVGEGRVYIDEVRLYRQAPTMTEEVDPGTENLVAYWPLDDGSGSVVSDAFGDLDGAIVGLNAWVDGVKGSALKLNGSTNYVNVAANEVLDLTEAVTVSFWVNAADCGNGEFNPFVSKGDTSFSCRHNNGNNLQFVIYGSDDSWHMASYAVDDSFNGNWHYIAGSYDGTQIKLYVDGLLKASVDYEDALRTNTAEFTFGSNSEVDGRLYEGIIDEVRLYDRALSEGEIRFVAGE